MDPCARLGRVAIFARLSVAQLCAMKTEQNPLLFAQSRGVFLYLLRAGAYHPAACNFSALAASAGRAINPPSGLRLT
jgi:hypothetical protein